MTYRGLLTSQERIMNRFIAAAVLAAAFTAPLHAAENWVASWQASPHAAWRSGDFVLPTGIPDNLAQQTVRETARISVGGRRVRIVLSNRYGGQPLVIGEAHVARAAGGDGGIAPGTDQVLTFGGQRGTVIPAGAPAVSDALEMPMAALEKLAVSVYLPKKTPLDTFHWGAQQTGHIAAGNVAGAAALPGATPLHGRALLAGIWVDAAVPTRAVIAFGDSITDGNGSTPDSDRRWPDQLAGDAGASRPTRCCQQHAGSPWSMNLSGRPRISSGLTMPSAASAFGHARNRRRPWCSPLPPSPGSRGLGASA
jgi:hypothetical protein